MICKLSEELIIFICKKLHRFTYLNNLIKTNSELRNIINYVKHFHYNKLKIHLKLDTNNNINQIYKVISENLFNSKILNVKKINTRIFKLQLPNLIKILVIFNEYYLYNVNSNHIKIISYNQLLEPINTYQDDIDFFPFLIFNIYAKFFIFVEYNFKNNNYRLKIKSLISNTNVGLYKNISEYDILKMITLTPNDLLNIYL